MPPPPRPSPFDPGGANLTSLADKLGSLREKLEQRRARYAEARAAYPGDCYDCCDTGWLASGPDRGTPCPHCARGARMLEIEADAWRAKRVLDYLHHGGVPDRRADQTLDSYPATAQTAVVVDDLRAFLAGWDRQRGLILKGPYGTGKSGLLVGTLRELLARYYVPAYNPRSRFVQPLTSSTSATPLWFTTSTDLFDTLKGGFDNGAYAALVSRAQRVKLLALDDLGAEKSTEWVQERLFSIVNYRYEYELPTFVTTNYGLKQLGERIGQRVLERLLECCDALSVDGKNLRTGK